MRKEFYTIVYITVQGNCGRDSSSWSNVDLREFCCWFFHRVLFFRRKRWTRPPNWASWPAWVKMHLLARPADRWKFVGDVLRCCWCRKKKSCGCWPKRPSCYRRQISAGVLVVKVAEAASSGREQESDSEWARPDGTTAGPEDWWAFGAKWPWWASNCRHCTVRWRWLWVAAGQPLTDSVASFSVC